MDPLYDYVSEIANRMYPTWEFDDSCGEYFQTDSFRGWDFVHQLEDGRVVEMPLYERAVFGERSDYPLPAGYGY